jgi:lipopolysaccharide transport system permease protein
MTRHVAHRASPVALVESLWIHRKLIAQLVKREVLGRYRGSVLGLGWSFFNPVLMLVVYTFVFSVVFEARWGVTRSGSRADFAMLLFIGLIIHGFFAECLTRAPSLILENVNFVKKVVFPLEVLPLVVMGSALFHSLISFAVLTVALLIVHRSLPGTAIYAPLVFLPLVLAVAGFAWFLTSLGVFARDVRQVIGIVMTILLFLSPVFYPISSVPPQFRPWLLANPLTFVIEQSRAVLFFDVSPDWGGVLLYAAASAVVAWLGFAWFQLTRKGFADVV